jgi:hypothetical protein
MLVKKGEYPSDKGVVEISGGRGKSRLRLAQDSSFFSARAVISS